MLRLEIDPADIFSDNAKAYHLYSRYKAEDTGGGCPAVNVIA
jgi:hypothetical protein